MIQRTITTIILLLVLLLAAACRQPVFQSASVGPSALRDVPAMRLNYRFEPDIPPPTTEANMQEERNQSVQTDFDQNRPKEILDKTITSPNNQRVLAIYHNVADLPAEFRLEMYTIDGKSLRKITHEGMAVHFVDTIVWSPDSTAVAFVAMARLGKLEDSQPEPAVTEQPTPTESNSEADVPAEANSQPDAANTAPVANTGDGTASVLTFRTEQIYICDPNGADLKPLTQNEGLIYFYFVWAPDSSALAAQAAIYTEWKIWQYQADQGGQIFRPAGRPRIVEKNGRQRLLDDYPTQVRPVWSPDSAKVAAAFDKQVRIYDAIGNAPTQAAIPLRNQLLISSKAYEDIKRKEMGEDVFEDQNSNEGKTNKSPEKNANVNTVLPEGVLPDESTLVSFNPILTLKWIDDATLYFETAYLREFRDSANSVRSNVRWHRLIFSPQAVALGNQNR